MSRLLRLGVMALALPVAFSWAQPPPSPGPTFETKTDLGILRLLEISRVKSFGGTRPFSAGMPTPPGEGSQPFVRVVAQLETGDEEQPVLAEIEVKQARDDAGASLLPPASLREAAEPGDNRMGWVGANQALHVGRGMGQFARIQERTLTLLAPNLGATRLASLTFSLARTTGTSWEEVRFDLARPGSATSQQKGGVRAWLDSWRLGENAPVRTAEATIAAQRTSQQTPVLPSLCQVTLRSAAGKEIPGRITAGRPDEEGYQVLALFASIPVDFKPMDILFRFPVRADTKKIDVVFEDVPLP